MTRPFSATGRPLRVLFLDNSSTFGGAIESLAYLVDGLADYDVESVVVSGQPPGRIEEAFPKAITESVDIRLRWRDRTAPYRLARRMASSHLVTRLVLLFAAMDWHLRRTLPAAVRYARIGSDYDVHLVHLNNCLEGQLDGLLAAGILGVPCVAHARGFQNPTRALRWLVPRVDRHVAISGAIHRNLREIGAPKDRISVIHDGMNLDRFREPHDTRKVREDLGVPPEAPAFGLFGRIIEWKGVREFVRAAQRVLRRLGSAYAVVVGDESDGSLDYFREVRSLAEDSDVGDRILFTGYREDVPALMQSLDVVVHASIDPEPFGMVIAEAMAAGKAVVSADEGGPRDIVVDGETGYRVDPRDTKALASAISDLLEDPRKAEAMGRAGRRRAQRLFSKERYAREIARLYGELR